MSRSSRRRVQPADRTQSPTSSRRPGVPGFELHAKEGTLPDLGRAAPFVAAVAALALAWIAFARHPVGDYFTESDFYGYAWGARLIQRGAIDFTRYSVVGPLYELLLAAFSLVMPDAFRAAQLISALAAAGTLLAWAELMRRRVSGTAGFWTALFIAVNPVFLRYGCSATTDMLAVFLQSAAVLAILAGRGPRAPMVAGALVALAALARYSALYLVPAAALRYLLWPARDDEARPRPLPALGGFALGFGALAAPWLLLSLRAGQVPGSNLIASFSFYSDPSAGRNVQDLPPGAPASGYRSLGDLLREQPGALVARLAANLPDHLGRNLRGLIGAPVAAACALGAVLAALDGAWRRVLPVGLAGALLFLSLAPVFYSDRYALPLVPYYLALTGLAGSSRLLALRLIPPGVPLKWLAAMVPLALSLGSAVQAQRWAASQLPVEVRAAGEALHHASGVAVVPPFRGLPHAQLAIGVGVLSRKMHLWYYSGLDPVAFPRVASLAELAAHARENHARFLYFSWYEGELRPEFWYLLDTTAVVPGLERIRFAAANPAVLYRIGPEFGSDPDWLADPRLRRLHVARAQVQVLNDRDAWDAHLALGEEAIGRGDAAAALDHLLAVTRGNPGLASGWTRTGDALLALGRLEEARGAYERARRLEPAGVAARIGIGWTQLRSGRADLAAETWRPLVGETRDRATLEAMASAFERAGDTAALDAARKALAALGAKPTE